VEQVLAFDPYGSELSTEPNGIADTTSTASGKTHGPQPVRAHVDWRVAAQVGAWYLSSASMPNDPLVLAAYDRLQRETDHLFGTLVRARDEHAFRVVFTRCLAPYRDDHELIRAVREERLLEVTTAAVITERMHPLLGCEFGGAFDRFRAVHDLIGHGWFGFGFELIDEYAAWRVQDRLHTGIARRALATELCGVNSARWIIGEAPEHRAILVSPAQLDCLGTMPLA
jgi:hypothetical protein